MIHAVELDSQTSSFVRQLEEQRRIEKNLMVERVRGSKEGLESVFHDIKERVDALERMTNSVSTSYIAPIGWSQLIFAGTDGLSAGPSMGLGDRDDSICTFLHTRYLADQDDHLVTAHHQIADREPGRLQDLARAAVSAGTQRDLC